MLSTGGTCRVGRSSVTTAVSGLVLWHAASVKASNKIEPTLATWYIGRSLVDDVFDATEHPIGGLVDFLLELGRLGISQLV